MADFLFPLPGQCVICQRPCAPADMALCESCLEYFRRPFARARWLCSICGRPVEYPGKCSECVSAPRSFARVLPGSVYREPVRGLVHRLKYLGQPDLACPLSRLMLEALCNSGNQGRSQHGYDALVAVPVHPSRLAERQYNQARLLAAEIRHATGIPVVEALTKVHQPQSQASLDKHSRLNSLAGAFQARKGVQRRLSGATVLLVDDVFTTGATAHFCTLELLRAGATRVDVCVAAIGVMSAANLFDNLY